MNANLSFNYCKEYPEYSRFTIDNLDLDISYSGNISSYNNTDFQTKSGGFTQWLQDYMQFEEAEASHISEQLYNWWYYIYYNDKEI